MAKSKLEQLTQLLALVQFKLEKPILLALEGYFTLESEFKLEALLELIMAWSQHYPSAPFSPPLPLYSYSSTLKSFLIVH